MSKLKKIFFILPSLFGIFFFTASFVSAQQTVSPTPTYSGAEATIKQYLCTPNTQNTGTGFSMTTGNSGQTNTASNDLYNCINRMYRFAIAAGSALAVFFIVIAGYVYMSADGDGEAVSKAKGILASSLASLVILFAGYILLRALNPDLIQFQNVQPPSVNLGTTGFTPINITEYLTEGGTDTSPAPTVPAGNAATLAASILSNTKITLATVHVSGKTDTAFAKQNITDTKDGKPAQRSSYTDGGATGPGGVVAISSQLLQALSKLSETYSFRVSEIAGGVHSAGSDHYAGKAFDIDIINGKAINSSNPDAKTFQAACKALGARLALGPGDAGHSTHIHCSWP